MKNTKEILTKILAQRIMIIDGAMGTMIQRYQPTEADYRGDRFRSHHIDLKNAGDVLVLIDPRDMQVNYDKAKANYERAKIDYDRRKALATTGSVSADELTRSENDLAQTSATFREATLNLERTTVMGTPSGYVAH